MKDDILKVLKANSDIFTSGEELSDKLNVSRTAIWKSINQLKEMGYVIESHTKRGYKLLESPDSLIAFEIQPLLHTKAVGRKIIYHDQLDSTNNYAKKMAAEGFDEGTLIIAESQTSGRGRLGRNWISPRGKGIWMSILLKPKINPMDASKMTIIAVCAVCQGIEEACGIKASIKWPNDIVVRGKKLCGILTEMGAEMDEVAYLIVGIGINAHMDEADFSEEVKTMATSIKLETGEIIPRKQVVGQILNAFEMLYEMFLKTGSLHEIIPLYKEKSAVMGKEIRAISRSGEMVGRACDITDEGHLMLCLQDGSKIEIASGEVSVRGIYGYI